MKTINKFQNERHKARQQFLGRENMRPKNRCLAFKKQKLIKK